MVVPEANSRSLSPKSGTYSPQSPSACPEPPLGQGVQRRPPRGGQLPQVPGEVAVGVQQGEGEEFSGVEVLAVRAQDAGQEAWIAAGDEEADGDEVVGAVADHG